MWFIFKAEYDSEKTIFPIQDIFDGQNLASFSKGTGFIPVKFDDHLLPY
jgi:hypothetical protein